MRIDRFMSRVTSGETSSGIRLGASALHTMAEAEPAILCNRKLYIFLSPYTFTPLDQTIVSRIPAIPLCKITATDISEQRKRGRRRERGVSNANLPNNASDNKGGFWATKK